MYSIGDAHSANGSASRAHSKVEPDSLATKLKRASRRMVSASGPERIVVIGAVRSPATVHVQLAGVASTIAGRVDRADEERVLAVGQAR